VDAELGERVSGRPRAGRDDGSRSAGPDEKGASQMTKVLFVCMGNICRSPTAQGVFRKMVADAGLESVVLIESAERMPITSANHRMRARSRRRSGAATRSATCAHARSRRRISAISTLILAMDWENLALLQQQCPRAHKHKLHLLMRFAGEHDAATVSGSVT